MTAIGVPLVASSVGLLFVLLLVREVLRADPGNQIMVQISEAIQQGARAFLKREYSYVSILVVVVAGDDGAELRDVVTSVDDLRARIKYL